MLSSLPDRLRDPARLAALRRTALLDSPTEASFDRLTRLAARLLNAPVAMVSLVDVDRQFFKSAVGLPLPMAAVRQTPLSHSFCQHVVASGEPLVVENAPEHPLVCDNPAVVDLGVAAYAGIPLVTSDGHTLGSFCAIDTLPRTWSDDDLATLRDLADSVMTEIELRMVAQAADQERRGRERMQARLRQAEEQLRIVLDHAPALVYAKDRDGRYLFVNDRFRGLFGLPAGEIAGRTDADLFPAEIARAWQRSDRRVLETGQTVRAEEAAPHEDGPHTYLSIKAPLHDAEGAVSGLLGVSTDLTAQRRLDQALAGAVTRDHHDAEALRRALADGGRPDIFAGLSVAACGEAVWDGASGHDFADVFPLDGDLAVLALGRAPGASAGMDLRYALRAFLRDTPQPADVVRRLAEVAAGASLSLAVLVVNTGTGEARSVAHEAPPPLVLRAGGEVVPLSASGPDGGALRLRPGDLVVMASAGLLDARLGEEAFGPDRLARLAGQARGAGSLTRIGRAVLDGARAFAGGSLPDDATLLLAQRR